MPILTASPASATPDRCNVTITPSVTDDSVTLGVTLDASLTVADGACSNGATFYLGTTDDTFIYQLPRSLNWTSDDTLAIIGINDDTPILLAAINERVLTVAAGQRGLGPQTVDLTRLSIRGGRVTTRENGGGVFLDDSTVLTLRQTEFLDNHASVDPTDPDSPPAGGAVAAWEGTVVAITSRFEGNKADDGGGALSALHLDIQGSDFIRNAAGTADGWGGAIWNRSGGSVEVGPDSMGRPSRFIENTALTGGAINLEGASVSTIEANFERNSSTDSGGAITAFASGPLDIVRSSFEDDSTSGIYGGGAIWSDVELNISDSTFIGARSTIAGGGAVYAEGETAIEGSYFEGNSATSGGAIAGGGFASISVNNATFWGNSADDSGSGVYVGSNVVLSATASTFDDSATNNTSLIAVDGGATASLAGTILSKDASPASPCEGSVDDSGGNLVTAACGSLAVVSDDSLGLMQPTLNQIYPTNTGTTPTIGFEPSSIAINRYTAFCPSHDQRGVPRPQGTLCDAGAYEAGGIESITPPGSTSAAVGSPFTLSLSATGFDLGAFLWDDSGTTLPPGLTLSSTGVISGTPTTPGTYAFIARVTGPVDDATTAQTITVPGGPDPDPVSRASAPREVHAEAGVESAKASWLAPASTGAFLVTTYKAVASPGGATCMVAAPALTCTITGLTPGTPYTVTARALTGAGWSESSSPSSVVVPLEPPTPSPTATILITNSRDRAQKSMARIEGTTTGLDGAEVVPYLRMAGQTDFTPGASTRTVDREGNFVWQRKAKKRFTVYFVSGDVTSNRLVIRPE